MTSCCCCCSLDGTTPSNCAACSEQRRVSTRGEREQAGEKGEGREGESAQRSAPRSQRPCSVEAQRGQGWKEKRLLERRRDPKRHRRLFTHFAHCPVGLFYRGEGREKKKSNEMLSRSVGVLSQVAPQVDTFFFSLSSSFRMPFALAFRCFLHGIGFRLGANSRFKALSDLTVNR